MKQDRIMKIAAIYCGIFTLIIVFGLGYYMKNRTIVYATGGTLQESDAQFEIKKDKVSEVRSKELETDVWEREMMVEVPITESVTEDKFVLMNRYAEKSYDIYVEGLPENYYDTQKMQIDSGCVEEVTYSYVDGITRLELKLNSVYECEITREHSTLTLRLYSPAERYENIILVDVGQGAGDSGETLMLAEALEAVNVRKEYRLYFTRLEDSEQTAEEVLQLVELFEADVLLKIDTVSDTDLAQYGINVYYNEAYYTRKLDTAKLAYELAVKVAEHTYNRANGIWEMSSTASIPAIELQFGYLSNQKEAQLLQDEEYYDRIAAGIMEALDTVLGEKEAENQ